MRFKTTPFPHQEEEWHRSREEPVRAIFWEQGCGKSKLIVDTASWLYLAGKIDGVLVVAPNGVHKNWVDLEIPTHLSPDVKSSWAIAYNSQKSSTKTHQEAVRVALSKKALLWAAISYDGFMTDRGHEFVADVLQHRRVLYVLDESHYVKTPKAVRTKSILKSAKYAPYRRVLTGTPVSIGPFDTYSQIDFLDGTFWKRRGISCFQEFRMVFGKFVKGWNPSINPKTGEPYGTFDQLVGYRRLPQLREWLEEIRSRVTKVSAGLNLPPKLYTKRSFLMSDEQKRLYLEMLDQALAQIDKIEVLPGGDPECLECSGTGDIEHEGMTYPCTCRETSVTIGRTSTATLALVKLLRLQQITCGYLSTDDPKAPLYPIPGPNRRLELLMEILEASTGKVIIWARFTEDIDQIMARLAEEGKRAVRYDGKVGEDERALAKARFQGTRPVLGPDGQVLSMEEVPADEQAEYFVGNTAAGATGITLTAAHTTVYYSNNFKLIDRLQSEDRAHRIGQHNAVLYIDMEAENSVDQHIVKSLRDKFDIATQITGDVVKEWI